MATLRAGVIGIEMMIMMMCMTSSRAYIIHGLSEAETTPSVGQTDYDDMIISEMMTSEEEAEVDDMFSAQMRDDLKLELILKALVILKKSEGHSSSVSSWFPSYDIMPLEIKLKLILKAIVLLKNRPSDSMFAGHKVIQLKLTLILKAISILKGDETNLGLTIDTGSLKLALLLKAIDILEVYKGEYKDVIFFTESKKQLKLELILKAITLLKHGNWPSVDIDFWPIGEEDEGEGSQSKVTTPEQMTTIGEEDEGEGSQSEATTPEQMTTMGEEDEGEGSQSEATTPEQMTTMGEEDEGEGSQSEATTPEQMTTREAITTDAVTREETTVAVDATGEEATAVMMTRKPWLKHGLSKIFKWLKWVPKVIHKKKQLIFHKLSNRGER